MAAAPRLIRLVQADGRENTRHVTDEWGRRLELTPAAHALYRAGTGALPALAQGIAATDAGSLERLDIRPRNARAARVLRVVRAAIRSGTEVECVNHGCWEGRFRPVPRPPAGVFRGPARVGP